MTSSLADLVVYDAQGALAALVEVRGKLGTTPDWAAAFRRNLAAHGPPPSVRFFAIATPDRFYLWIDKTAVAAAVAPDLWFDTSAVLGPYYQGGRLEPGSLTEAGFELLVASWLGELASGGDGRIPPEAAEPLTRSGFLAAVRGGHIHQP